MLAKYFVLELLQAKYHPGIMCLEAKPKVVCPIHGGKVYFEALS